MVLYLLKMNGYVVRGSNITFSSILPSQLESILKGKNLLLGERILSFKSTPIVIKVRQPEKQSRRH